MLKLVRSARTDATAICKHPEDAAGAACRSCALCRLRLSKTAVTVIAAIKVARGRIRLFTVSPRSHLILRRPPSSKVAPNEQRSIGGVEKVEVCPTDTHSKNKVTNEANKPHYHITFL